MVEAAAKMVEAGAHCWQIIIELQIKSKIVEAAAKMVEAAEGDALGRESQDCDSKLQGNTIGRESQDCMSL